MAADAGVRRLRAVKKKTAEAHASLVPLLFSTQGDGEQERGHEVKPLREWLKDDRGRIRRRKASTGNAVEEAENGEEEEGKEEEEEEGQGTDAKDEASADVRARVLALRRAKLTVGLAYSLNSLGFVMLRLMGKDPQTHAVKEDLDRVKRYMARTQQIEATVKKLERRKRRWDKEAAAASSSSSSRSSSSAPYPQAAAATAAATTTTTATTQKKEETMRRKKRRRSAPA